MSTNVPIDEIERDLLFRQASLLYPDVEPWIINMSIDAYINLLGKEAEEEEPEPVKPLGASDPLGGRLNISKQCDDEVCLSCGS